jgi:uncharacterized protein
MITTQTEQENIAKVRRGYEAFSAGDAKTLSDLFSPTVIWRQTPAGAIAGTYDGRDKVMEYLQWFLLETQGTFKVTPVTYAASGDKVFVEQHISGTRKGQNFESDTVQRFTVSDGKIVEVVVYNGDYPNLLNAWK